jgi:hypothetical protein
VIARAAGFTACLVLLCPTVHAAIAQTYGTPGFDAQPPSTAPRPDGPAQTPPAWLPRRSAELQALDKVSARSAAMEAKVGSPVQYGSLTITVQSCMVRPPDQRPDAAAFIVVADAHQGEPGFRGWMFASAPSVSMLQHPVYDIRLLGCRS